MSPDLEDILDGPWDIIKKNISTSRKELLKLLEELKAIQPEIPGRKGLVSGTYGVNFETFDKARRCLVNLPIFYTGPDHIDTECDICGEKIGFKKSLGIAAYEVDEGVSGGFHTYWIELITGEFNGRRYKIKLLQGRTLREIESCYACVGKGLEPKIEKKYNVQGFELEEIK